jgi:hypothetical protein
VKLVSGTEDHQITKSQKSVIAIYTFVIVVIISYAFVLLNPFLEFSHGVGYVIGGVLYHQNFLVNFNSKAYTCLTGGQKSEFLSRVLQGTPLIIADRFGDLRRDRPWET